MNPQIKRLFFVVFVMFLSLMVACTYIQFLGADSLNADGRNSRAFYRSKYIERGPIMVGENAIAASEPTKDSTGLLRAGTAVLEPDRLSFPGR